MARVGSYTDKIPIVFIAFNIDYFWAPKLSSFIEIKFYNSLIKVSQRQKLCSHASPRIRYPYQFIGYTSYIYSERLNDGYRLGFSDQCTGGNCEQNGSGAMSGA